MFKFDYTTVIFVAEEVTRTAQNKCEKLILITKIFRIIHLDTDESGNSISLPYPSFIEFYLSPIFDDF